MGKHIGTGGLAWGKILGRLAFYTWVVKRLILVLESPGLPTGFEKLSMLRSHFEQYCQVSGIVFLSNKDGVRRALVAFPSDGVARALQGTKQKIGRAIMELKPVSCSTV